MTGAARCAALAAAAALAALLAPGGAAAAPWCGTDAVAADRQPDAIRALSIHVVYALPARGADRFWEWAPRIVDDVDAVEAWWRREDPGRRPRFDLHAFPGCQSRLGGALDLSRLQLPGEAAEYTGTSPIALRAALEGAFASPFKKYLVYYDGPVAEAVCGRGGADLAIVYAQGSCAASSGRRAWVAAHELIHALGALPAGPGPPHACPDDPAHPCDSPADVLHTQDRELGSAVLDFGRDDYYGHRGSWLDLRESPFLEWLDSRDSVPPARPAVTPSGAGRELTLAWSASRDPSGPLTYHVLRDGEKIWETTRLRFVDLGTVGEVARYELTATDREGRLSAPATVRVRYGYGLVDETGRLVRDVVAPAAVERAGIRVRRAAGRVLLSWRPVADPLGLRGYRVTAGRSTRVVPAPAVSLPARLVRGRTIAIRSLDRAGNESAPVRVRAVTR